MDLHHTRDFVKQAIGYGWNAGITWVILTNFKELIIYNADWGVKDELQSRFWKFKYTEYIDRFEDLWKLSFYAFPRGELDKEAEKSAKKAKRIRIDEALLGDLMTWRDKLIKNIKKHNDFSNLPDGYEEELVQMILNRLIFIRFTEDRQHVDPQLKSKLLRAHFPIKFTMVKMLAKIFRTYDEWYNSELFKGDFITNRDLRISNDLIIEIIKGLYTGKNGLPYLFSQIDADVLGNLYENYIEQIQKKKGGIYYTPTYIVNYIVNNTVGQLLKTKKPEEIKILDPACGSGSFLIKAFDKLKSYYVRDGAHYQEKLLAFTDVPDKQFKRDMRILKSSIFGLDKDYRAVEIGRLNLLLKAAEKKAKLPNINDNLQWGDSLIDDESLLGGNVRLAKSFKERFPEITKNGGFDVVIGNPPYVNFNVLKKDNAELSYYKTELKGKYKFNLYTLFILRAFELLKEGGYMSFIVPNSLSKERYNEDIRNLLLRKSKIIKLVDFSKTNLKIFEDASNDGYIIFIVQKTAPKKSHKIEIDYLTSDAEFKHSELIEQQNFLDRYQSQFIFGSSQKLSSKIAKGKILLKDICLVRVGLTPSKPYKKKYGDDYNNFKNKYAKSHFLRKYLNNNTRGDKVSRYGLIHKSGKYLVWDERKLYEDKVCPGELENYDAPKLIMRNRGMEIICSFYEDKMIVNDIFNVCVLKKDLSGSRRYEKYSKNEINLSDKYSLKFILAIINSKLAKFYLKNNFAYRDIRAKIIELLPIPTSNVKQEKLVKLVDKMLSLKERQITLEAIPGREKEFIEKEIASTDAKINNKVYKLYKLTKKEIEVVENSAK